MKKSLTLVFWIDGLIALAFGIYSWIFPFTTFGKIFQIPKEHTRQFLSLFSGFSLFYVIIGLVCIICSKSTFRVHFWIGLLMLVRHLVEGLLKINDLGQDWLIGNPYPDLIIHSVFTLAYAIEIYDAYKNRVL